MRQKGTRNPEDERVDCRIQGGRLRELRKQRSNRLLLPGGGSHAAMAVYFKSSGQAAVWMDNIAQFKILLKKQ